jgi:hypothetical protein
MNWAPNPGPQTEFFSRYEFEVLYGGARGGGKTDAILMDHLRGTPHSRYRGLILRRTFPELREIIDRSHIYFNKIADPKGRIVKPAYNASDHVWTFPTGAKVEFGSMMHEESKQNYIGREFTRVSFDQVEQFTETQYLFMLGQIRTTVPELVKYIGVRSTGNPGGPGHGWVKRRWIDNKKPYQRYKTIHATDLGALELDSVFIPAKVFDNPKITENNPQYIAMLSSLPNDLKRAWLDGDWDVFVGQFFTSFKPIVHGIDPFIIPTDGFWTIYGGLDYGEGNATSFGLYAVSYEGVAYRVAEYYSPGSAPDHARMILQLIKNCEWTQGRSPKYIYADPSMWTRRRIDVAVSVSAYQTLDSYGIKGLIPASNDRVNGWRELKRRLHWEMSDLGNWLIKPTFYYFNGCNPNFERTIPACVYPPIQGTKVAEDMDKKGEDHCADEARYFVMGLRVPDGETVPERPSKPDAHRDGHRAIQNLFRKKKTSRQVGGIARVFAERE